VIQGFRHKGLKRLFERGDASGVNAEFLEKLENILAVLNRARKPSDMGLPGFRLHPLKGKLKGFWGVTVRETGVSCFASRMETPLTLI
jgi:toxin HigB-1